LTFSDDLGKLAHQSGMSRAPRCKSDKAVVAVEQNLSSSSNGVTFQFMQFASKAIFIGLLFCGQICRSEETNAVPPMPGRADDTNAQDTLRAYLVLQEQLHQTRLAIEQNRMEAREAASQNAEALAQRLQMIEKALSAQRARELDAMQSSNRVMLTVAGTFAAVGFIAMLLMAYFQWRTVHGLAGLSATLPSSRTLSGGPPVAALGSVDAHLVDVGPAAQSNVRLLGSLEQLEKRIYELEHTSHPTLKEGVTVGEKLAPNENGEPAAGANRPGQKKLPESSGAGEASRVTLLLGKGQSMLNLDNAEAALKCFEEAVELEPNNADALIKQGTALERLQRFEEAVDCYDRAITVDGSMTIAYLHKGGLYNRMERFNEALECYEQALRSQEKRHA